MLVDKCQCFSNPFTGYLFICEHCNERYLKHRKLAILKAQVKKLEKELGYETNELKENKPIDKVILKGSISEYDLSRGERD